MENKKWKAVRFWSIYHFLRLTKYQYALCFFQYLTESVWREILRIPWDDHYFIFFMRSKIISTHYGFQYLGSLYGEKSLQNRIIFMNYFIILWTQKSSVHIMLLSIWGVCMENKKYKITGFSLLLFFVRSKIMSTHHVFHYLEGSYAEKTM